MDTKNEHIMVLLMLKKPFFVVHCILFPVFCLFPTLLLLVIVAPNQRQGKLWNLISKALCTIGGGGGGMFSQESLKLSFFLSFLHTPRKMHATRLPSFVREIPKRTLSFSCAIFSPVGAHCGVFLLPANFS